MDYQQVLKEQQVPKVQLELQGPKDYHKVILVLRELKVLKELQGLKVFQRELKGLKVL